MKLPVVRIAALSAVVATRSVAQILALALVSMGALSTAVAAETKAAFKPDAAKGAQLSASCQACHAADGTRGSPANPILQGQHPEYLVKQLTEFKSGKRKNAIMSGMAAALSEDDMKHIAAFYASKKAKDGFAKSKDTVLLGEQIWRGGIVAKQVPACAGCHSPTGAGIPAQYPRIGGQHADYTTAQLQSFSVNQRANSVQMTAIAAKLNEREMKAVADYAAGLR